MTQYRISVQSTPRMVFAAMRAGGRALNSRSELVLYYLSSFALAVMIPIGAGGMFIAIRYKLDLEPIPANPLVLPLFALAVTFGLIWYLVQRPGQRAARRGAEGALGRDVEMTLDPNGVRLEGGKSVWFAAWQDIDDVISTKMLLVMVFGGIVFYAPREAFANAEEAEQAFVDMTAWHSQARGL